ncbi:MAG TPA: protein kinase [Haliangium sp.]|nr:protein kinase [Haliangium sp.]
MPELGRIAHFRLIRPLGAGGMGEVFLAHDERLNRQVAIKRLRTSSDTPSQRSERFQREARIAARLKHPAIVQIYELLNEGGVDCIVMEYVEGEDLRRHVATAPPSVHQVLVIGQQIALAMAEAHDQGIIHRDLKTENVLITRSQQVKITDFGIAKDLHEEALTAEGHMLGTFRAMSPEQARGERVDYRSDLFSFGILLYEALTGTSPFHAAVPYLTLDRVVHASPYPIRTLRPELPAALAALIDQLLQKDPLLRPRNFHEVAQALAEIEGGPHGKPCTHTPPTGRPPLDTDGNTVSTEDPGPTPEGDAARARARPDETETLTPSASPAAVLVDAAADSDLVETESLPDIMQPTAPAPAAEDAMVGQVDESSSAGASSALEPGLSPRRVRTRARRIAIMAVLGSALGLGLGTWTMSRPGNSYTYVAVPRPGLDASAAAGDGMMAAAVRGGIVRGLSDLEGVVVLPLHDVTTVTEGFLHARKRRPDAGEIIGAMGADEVVETDLACTAERCRVSWRRIARGDHIHGTGAFEIPRDDAIGSEQDVIAKLRALYRDHDLREDSDPVQLAPADEEAFLRLRNAHWADEGTAASDEMLDQLDAIRERSPGFLDVYRLEIAMLQRRWRHGARDADRARALVLVREAEKRAPDSYAILATLFELALPANLLDLARDTLRRIEALDPASGWTLMLRGQWHARIGEHDKALAVLQRAATRGSYWRIQHHLAAVQRDRDGLDEARGHIERLLRQSPGNYAGLSRLASLEMRSSNPACAVELYSALVVRHRYYDECNNLGVAETLLDRYGEAAASFRCALETRPGDPLASFNLAEALKLAGDTQQANEKFREFLAVLRASKPLRTGEELGLETLALAHLAQHDARLAAEARELMQRVLAETTESPSHAILYRAATVHALLGDDADTVEHVRTLLDGGWLASWFRFPWFDGVRSHPELKQRLAYESPAPTCQH